MDTHGRYGKTARRIGVETRVGRWGNSLAIRIPSAFARETGLEEGERVELSVSDGGLMLRPVRPVYSLEQLLAGVMPENRPLETEWGEPVGNETW
jgi:antitoxin MazE